MQTPRNPNCAQKLGATVCETINPSTISLNIKLVWKYFKIPVPVYNNEGSNPEDKMNNKRKGRGGGSTAAGWVNKLSS